MFVAARSAGEGRIDKRLQRRAPFGFQNARGRIVQAGAEAADEEGPRRAVETIPARHDRIVKAADGAVGHVRRIEQEERLRAVEAVLCFGVEDLGGVLAPAVERVPAEQCVEEQHRH